MSVIRRIRRVLPRKQLIVDPAGCGCVQCVVGDSVPADRLTESQKDQVVDDYRVTDRTGYTERQWEWRL